MLVSYKSSQFILIAHISNNQYFLSNAKQIEPKKIKGFQNKQI
jgi:hypothetical protein